MNNDLIRRSDTLKSIANDGDEHWWYEERINEVPAVDAVEVVRCRHCKYHHYICISGFLDRKEDDFCSCGERRMDGE